MCKKLTPVDCYHVFVFLVCFCGAPRSSVLILDIIYKKIADSVYGFIERESQTTSYLNQEESPHRP